MNTQQRSALQLAKQFESLAVVGVGTVMDKETAAELRRLHEENQVIREALKRCSMFAGSPETIYRITKAAIAKATGENK